MVNDRDEVLCSLVMAKSRVTPLKPVTVPRLELTAAVLSTKISDFLQKELRYDDIPETFWTDSKVVLGYISNDARRFHTFVANRVQAIRDRTSPKQWNYVDTKDNPADDAKRPGSSRTDQKQQMVEWSKLLVEKFTDNLVLDLQVSLEDPEVKRVSALATTAMEPQPC